jgi:hypothetical protein
VLRRSRRHVTGVGGQIEQPRSWPCRDGIQERLDEPGVMSPTKWS